MASPGLLPDAADMIRFKCLTRSSDVKVMKILRNGVAGALIASVPLSASVAATRPSAAVPVAGSTAAAAQVYDDERRGGISWVAVGVIIFAAAVALWIALDDDDDGEVALTRG
jgi:hypothetical protein